MMDSVGILRLQPNMPVLVEAFQDVGWACQAQIRDPQQTYRSIRLYHGQTELQTDVLYLDASVVKSGIDGEYVSVIGEDGLKEKVLVTTGIVCDDMVEILTGLAEGDKVIKE